MKTEDFYFDAVISNVSSTSRWRGKQAIRYPQDKRNATAAIELGRLSKSKFSDVSPDVWLAIKPHLGTDVFMQAVNESTRAVSFRFAPEDINDLLRYVAETAKGFALPVSILIGGAR